MPLWHSLVRYVNWLIDSPIGLSALTTGALCQSNSRRWTICQATVSTHNHDNITVGLYARGPIVWRRQLNTGFNGDRFQLRKSSSGHFILLWNLISCANFHSWWRHQVETFSALLAICAGNSPFPGEFPTRRPVTRSFDVLAATKQL